jgi:sarcosine oxidase subunit alpha
VNQPYRLATGGRIDRSRKLDFDFDGRRFEGHRGDTLASALLANGVHLAGRSFKYHRPRGIYSAGVEEPNALVEIDRGGGRTTPNLRMTEVELYQGLKATSLNRRPSLRFDLGAINDLFSPLLVAGFYYKTFMGPRFAGGAWAWNTLFEPVIRRAVGLGKAPAGPDPDRYTNRFEHCDVLVIGGGAAGIAATLGAAENGAKVVLCDERPETGGWLLAESAASIDGRPARDWALDALSSLALSEKVRILPRTTAFGHYGRNFVALAERLTDHLAKPAPTSPRERLWQLRAREVIVAAGAIERPPVFPGNDRPGIMLAGAARAYLNQYGVLPGRRIVLFAATDDAYRSALELRAAGAEIVVILDRRESMGASVADARAAGIRVETGAEIVGTSGRLRIERAEFVTAVGREAVACDCLLVSDGWTPSVHLHSQARGKLKFDGGQGCFVPDGHPEGMRSVGACNGAFSLQAALNEGYASGEAAARRQTSGAGGSKTFSVADDIGMQAGLARAAPPPGSPGKAFVDLQNDVTARDIRLAAQEGMRSIEHMKRFTTAGMASDQGKTANVNALATAAQALGRDMPQVGLTSYRRPFTPVTFGLFAGAARGELFDPLRRTPIHDWAEGRGAVFEDVGAWKRARYFPRPGENMRAAVERECLAVRECAGLFDASTLGKIEVVGPDAAEFLNRLYVNDWTRLAPGRCRYGIMLNEAGYVMDDGVIGRLAPDRFHVTTTTGGAARVLHHMEDYLQTEFPDLDVWLTSTSEQWAVVSVQGPKARDILAPLISGIDMSREAMPHLSVREGTLRGVPLRLFRVSFTGELGYEVNVPARFGRSVWEAIWSAAEGFGATAYGTEATHVLRAEKGYVIVGQETDGTMTADDVGLAWAIGKSKRDFVGKRGMMRPDLVAPGRKQLVGLLTEAPSVVLEEGAQIVERPDPPPGSHALGHVTSAYWSATLGRSIALAVVEGGRARIGRRLHVPMQGKAPAVRVVEPVFHDREGVRLHA